MDRKQCDSGPPEADEDPVRAGHVGDRKVRGLCGTGASLPRVQGVDSVLGGHGEHRQDSDRERLWHVLFGGFGGPGQQKRRPEDRQPGDEDGPDGSDVFARMDGSVPAVGSERPGPGNDDSKRHTDGDERMAEPRAHCIGTSRHLTYIFCLYESGSRIHNPVEHGSHEGCVTTSTGTSTVRRTLEATLPITCRPRFDRP